MVFMLERIADIIREQLNLDDVEITEETSFKDDLQADSLDLFELVMAFEEEYGIEIPSEDLEKLATVGDVIDYIKDQGIDA
ncbi:MAG: acyl carrier protein [Lachnospiraceae bacterium]|nr:acyl carrier protein [Lachnospiraceae bacterium]